MTTPACPTPARTSRRLGTLLALLATTTLMTPVQPAWAETIQDQQWYLDTLSVDQAHQISQGSGILVAVVDTGVGEHEDLTGQVLTTGYSFIEGGIEFDWDGAGHGTGMAGLIAATGADENHYLGIAPQAQIVSVRISANAVTRGAQMQIPKGIRWAVDNGAKIINISFGSATATDDEISAVEYALSKDVLIVAGTGNVTDDHPESTGLIAPASIPGVLAVTGTDRDGNLAATAVRGEGTMLAAPGSDIPLLLPSNLYSGNGTSYSDPTEGTSISTAIVSGAAALVWSKYPDLTANEVIERLIATADDKGATGYDTEYGYGELNILQALTATDVPTVVANPLTTEGAAANASAQAAQDTNGETTHTTTIAIAIAATTTLLVAILIAALWIQLRRRRPTNR